MKKLVCFIIMVSLTLYSGNSWSSEKQTERKNSWSKGRIALAVVAVLAVVGGTAAVKVIHNNKNLAKMLENAQRANKETTKLLGETKELYTKGREEVHTLHSVWKETAKDVEAKVTRIEELEAQRTKLIGQVEDAHDVEEKSIAELLNSLASSNNIEYSDDLVKQIKDIRGSGGLGWYDFMEYFNNGNLQGMIRWLRDTGKMEKAKKLEELLTSVLKEEEIVKVERAGGGRTGALILTFKNGVRGVFKHKSEQWEGIAMYRFDKLLGTNSFPMTVKRAVELRKGAVELGDKVSFNGPVLQLEGSVQLFVENGIELSHAGEIYGKAFALPRKPRRVNTLALLANDTDMGSHNVLVPARGQMLAIDGGHAFNVYRGHLPGSDEKITVSSTLHGKIHKYYTHPDFISRLQNITDENLRHVAEPLFNFFPKEEMAILKKFDEAIDSINSSNELAGAIKTATLSDMADQLRALYKKTFSEDDLSEIEEILIERVNLYRDHLQVPAFLRNRIDEYVEAVQASR